MSLNEKWEVIKLLDLSNVKERFKKKKSGFWKKKINAESLENEYRQFLYLAAINPNEVVVPWTQELDDFWHEHILDTAKYIKDCEAIFGKVFHHNPNLPKGSKEQVTAFDKTKKLYKEAFTPKAKAKAGSRNSGSTDSSSPGCGGTFVPIFCGGSTSHSSSHSDSSSHSSHSSSCGGHSSSSSCGGGSASSCSSCGGGGGCGGD